MKKTYWLRIAGGLILWTIVIGLFLVLYNPLGPQLPSAARPTPTASPKTTVASDLPTPISEDFATPHPLPALTPTPIINLVTPTPAVALTSTCGSSGAMTFLVIGENPAAQTAPTGVLTIRLAKFDFGIKRINVLSVPAQMVVTAPSLGLTGFAQADLSSLYYNSKSRAAGSNQVKTSLAVATLAQTIQNNFGFYPDHYVAVRSSSLATIIDAIGGIDVSLPIPVDGRFLGRRYYPSGGQHLNGSQSLDLILILDSPQSPAAADWDQYHLTTLVLQALARKAETPAMALMLPSILADFNRGSTTDLSIKNFIDLACLMNAPDIQVRMDTINASMLTVGASGQTLPRIDLLSQFILATVGK